MYSRNLETYFKAARMFSIVESGECRPNSQGFAAIHPVDLYRKPGLSKEVYITQVKITG